MTGSGPRPRPSVRAAGPGDLALLGDLGAGPPSTRPHQRLFPGASEAVSLDSGSGREGVLIADAPGDGAHRPLGALAWRERSDRRARAELLLAPGVRGAAPVAALLRALMSTLDTDDVTALEIEVCPENAPLASAARASGLAVMRRRRAGATVLEYELGPRAATG